MRNYLASGACLELAPESKHVRMMGVEREGLCEGCFGGVKVAQRRIRSS